MMRNAPDVSAVVPVYCVERYVEAAVRSLLQQTGISLEVVVVDDASPDSSIERVAALADSRIRIIAHARNRGLANARNTGILAARGRLIALLDADDVAMPHRLARQARALQARPEAIMCGSAVQCIDQSGQATGRIWRQTAPEAMLPATLLFSNAFYVSSLLVRASVARDLLYRAEFEVCEDYDFNVRAIARGAAFNVASVLTQYRINPAGLSATKTSAMRENERKIQLRQLNQLEIQPNERELRLHGHLAFEKLDASRGLLAEIDDWLVRLKRVNEQSRRYAFPAFRQVLELRWLDACAHACDSGVDGVSAYFRGHFARKTPSTLGRLAKLKWRTWRHSARVTSGAPEITK